MGCFWWIESYMASKQSKLIDKYLRDDWIHKHRTQVKIFLHGTHGAGKTTLIKQLGVIYTNGPSEDDMLKCRSLVYMITQVSFLKILRAMPQLGINFNLKNSNGQISLYRSCAEAVAVKFLPDGDGLYDYSNGPFSPELLLAMKLLWRDFGVQECFKRSNEYDLGDSAEYLLDNVDRLGSEDFTCTEEDYLRIHEKPSLTEEIIFPFKNLKFGLFEFGVCWRSCSGGRRKWISLISKFNDFDVVIFAVDLSGYDKKIPDGCETNSMEYSLKIFESMINSTWFTGCTIILLLNKMDIIEEKLRTTPLTCCFPEYTGGQNLDEACDFIQAKFESMYHSTNKKLDCYRISALKKSDVDMVMNCIADNFKARRANSTKQ